MSEIIFDNKCRLLEWINEVYDHFEWNKDAVGTTVKLLEAQLNNYAEDYHQDNRKKLAITTMLIVGKAHGENIGAMTTELTNETGPIAGVMTANELIDMEREVLRKIIDDASILILVPDTQELASKYTLSLDPTN